MNNQTNTQYIYLSGKWQSVNIGMLLHSGWEILKHYQEDEMVWSFSLDGIVSTVTTNKFESPVIYASYLYKKDEKFLMIDGHDLDRDGNIHARIIECYRIEFVSPDEIYLYDLEDVEVEPDDYSLRIHLKRYLR